jgi:hypothetical protein
MKYQLCVISHPSLPGQQKHRKSVRFLTTPLTIALHQDLLITQLFSAELIFSNTALS